MCMWYVYSVHVSLAHVKREQRTTSWWKIFSSTCMWVPWLQLSSPSMWCHFLEWVSLIYLYVSSMTATQITKYVLQVHILIGHLTGPINNNKYLDIFILKKIHFLLIWHPYFTRCHILSYVIFQIWMLISSCPTTPSILCFPNGPVVLGNNIVLRGLTLHQRT